MSTDDTQKWIDTWNHREREKQLDLLGPSVCNPVESWYFALHMFENRCDDFWFQMCHLMQKKRRLKEQKKKETEEGKRRRNEDTRRYDLGKQSEHQV